MIFLIFFGQPAFADCSDDDIYEDNDTFETAQEISGGTETGLVVCEQDEDWFALYTEPGDLIQADISFIDEEGDIDIKLFHEDDLESSIISSFSITDNESLFHMTQTGGVHYLRVYHFDPKPGSNRYDLSFGARALEECPIDTAETNNSLETAALFTEDLEGLYVCPFDEDWFRFSFEANKRYVFSLRYDPLDGQPKGVLYDQYGYVQADFSDVSEGVQQLDILEDYAREGLINITADMDMGAYGIPYTLEVEEIPRAPCIDDEDIDNSYMDAAIALDFGTHDLVSCDEEYFSLDIPESSKISFRVEADNPQEVFDLYIYDSDQYYIDDASSINGVVNLSLTFERAQKIYLHPFIWSDQGDFGLNYTLSITQEDYPNTTSENEGEAGKENTKTGCQIFSVGEMMKLFMVPLVVLSIARQRYS